MPCDDYESDSCPSIQKEDVIPKISPKKNIDPKKIKVKLEYSPSSKKGSEVTKSKANKDTVSANGAAGTKIVRNYAKALCSFASSDIALPYLKNTINSKYQGSIDIGNFQKYMKEKKGNTASIQSLRKMLMIEVGDSNDERAYKEIFKELSIIFIKYFSVNWIFSGKVKYRLEHIRYRHKMLRRVLNPQYFTYLKG